VQAQVEPVDGPPERALREHDQLFLEVWWVIWRQPQRKAEKIKKGEGLIDNKLHECYHAVLYRALRERKVDWPTPVFCPAFGGDGLIVFAEHVQDIEELCVRKIPSAPGFSLLW